MKRYYLIVDNSMGLMTHIVRLEDEEIKEMIEVSNRIISSCIDNITSRESHFGNRMFGNLTYSGWTISATEFNRIKETVELFPQYEKYLTLCKL